MKTMKSFGKSSFTLEERHVNQIPNMMDCYYQLGQTVYQPITIDRETIKNANEEQLWALYNALESAISLNVYNEQPDSSKDYEIELN